MIRLSNKAYIDLPKNANIKKIKKEFTIVNPMFSKLETMGKSTWAIPDTLKYYEFKDNKLILPLGGAQRLSKFSDFKNQKIVDDRFENKKKINFKFKGTLRPYQEKGVNELYKKSLGVLQATTGSGKTIISIGLIAKRKQPTLFLVNTIELANQFIDKVIKFSNLSKDDIGMIGGGSFILKDITVCTLQTLYKLDENKTKQLNKLFSQVIVDEAHIVPADTFYIGLNKLKAKYKYGITATPMRADGLTEVIFLTVGNIIHKIPPSAVSKHLIIPEVKFIFTDYNFPIFDSSEHAYMISDMAIDKKRNKLILDTYNDVGKNRFSVFISHRTAQLDELKNKIPNSVILTSKVSKKKRKKIMEDLSKGKYKAVLTTYGLFSTGIDLPALEVVYMCTPMKSPRWIIQTAGRVKRKSKGKISALVVDFVDRNIGMLEYQYFSRKRTWKKIKNQEI